eukprot:jgi/Mesvir1/12316/Mv00510-RA.2
MQSSRPLLYVAKLILVLVHWIVFAEENCVQLWRRLKRSIGWREEVLPIPWDEKTLFGSSDCQKELKPSLGASASVAEKSSKGTVNARPGPPRNLGIVLSEWDRSDCRQQLASLSALLVWCSEVAVRHVSVYEPSGELKRDWQRLQVEVSARCAAHNASRGVTNTSSKNTRSWRASCQQQDSTKNEQALSGAVGSLQGRRLVILVEDPSGSPSCHPLGNPLGRPVDTQPGNGYGREASAWPGGDSSSPSSLPRPCVAASNRHGCDCMGHTRLAPVRDLTAINSAALNSPSAGCPAIRGDISSSIRSDSDMDRAAKHGHRSGLADNGDAKGAAVSGPDGSPVAVSGVRTNGSMTGRGGAPLGHANGRGSEADQGEEGRHGEEGVQGDEGGQGEEGTKGLRRRRGTKKEPVVALEDGPVSGGRGSSGNCTDASSRKGASMMEELSSCRDGGGHERWLPSRGIDHCQGADARAEGHARDPGHGDACHCHGDRGSNGAACNGDVDDMGAGTIQGCLRAALGDAVHGSAGRSGGAHGCGCDGRKLGHGCHDGGGFHAVTGGPGMAVLGHVSSGSRERTDGAAPAGRGEHEDLDVKDLHVVPGGPPATDAPPASLGQEWVIRVRVLSEADGHEAIAATVRDICAHMAGRGGGSQPEGQDQGEVKYHTQGQGQGKGKGQDKGQGKGQGGGDATNNLSCGREGLDPAASTGQHSTEPVEGLSGLALELGGAAVCHPGEGCANPREYPGAGPSTSTTHWMEVPEIETWLDERGIGPALAPRLVLVFGPVMSLLGFPPWQTQQSEILVPGGL